MVKKAKHPGLPLALWDQGIRVGPPPKPNREIHPYQGTIHFQGLLINVENLAGSTRRGTSPDGKPWSTRMRHHYGEIAGTQGSDGDPVDCFVGPNPIAPTAYVIHQKQLQHERDAHPVGTYEEDKVMLGFSSRGSAINAYRKHYDVPTLNPGISEIPVSELRRRCENGELNFGSALVKSDPAHQAELRRQYLRHALGHIHWAADQHGSREAKQIADRVTMNTLGRAGVRAARSTEPVPVPPRGDSAPRDAHRELSAELSFAHEDSPHMRSFFDHVLPHVVGATPIGAHGETAPFDALIHRTGHDLLPGDPAHVIRPGWRSSSGKTLVHADVVGGIRKADLLPGGQGDHLHPSDVDADQLAEGIKHEMEHTDDPKIAREIALDHLAEDPHYYTKLKRIEKSDYEYSDPWPTQPPAGPGWEKAPHSKEGRYRRRKGTAAPAQPGVVEEPQVQRTLSAEPIQPALMPQPVEPLPAPAAAPEEEVPEPKVPEPEPKPKAKKEQPEPEEQQPEPEEQSEEEKKKEQFTEAIWGHLAWLRKNKKGNLNPDEKQTLAIVAMECCGEQQDTPSLYTIPARKLTEPPEMDEGTRDKLGKLLGDAHEKFPDAQRMIEGMMKTLVGAEPLHEEGEVAHFNPEHHEYDYTGSKDFYDPKEGQDAVTATTTGHHIPDGPVLVRAKTRKPTLEEDPNQAPPATHGPTAVFEESKAKVGTRLYDLEHGVYHMTEMHDIYGKKGDKKIGVDMPIQHQNELIEELWPNIQARARQAIKDFKLEFTDENIQDLEQAVAIGVIRGLARYKGGFGFWTNSNRIIAHEVFQRAMSQANMPEIPKSKLDMMRGIDAAATRAAIKYGVDMEQLAPEQIAECWGYTKKDHFGRELKRYTVDGVTVNQESEQVPMERWRPLDENGNPIRGTVTRPGKLALIKEIDDLRRGRHMHDSFWMDENPESMMDLSEDAGVTSAYKEAIIEETKAVLADMPEDQRRILWDWKYHGHTQKKQAEAMSEFQDVPFPTVKRKMKRLRDAALQTFIRTAAERHLDRRAEDPESVSPIQDVVKHIDQWKKVEAQVLHDRGETETVEPPDYPEHLFGPSQNELEEQYGSREHAKMIMDARFLNERAHEKMKNVIDRINAGEDDDSDHIFIEKVQRQAKERYQSLQRPTFHEVDPHEPRWVGSHSPFDKEDPIGHVLEQIRTNPKDKKYNPEATPAQAAEAYVEKRRGDYPISGKRYDDRHRSRRIEHFNVALDKTQDPEVREVLKTALREELEDSGRTQEDADRMTGEARKRSAAPKIEDASTWQELHDAVMKEKPKNADSFWFFLAAREGADARTAARALMDQQPSPVEGMGRDGLLRDPKWADKPLNEINEKNSSVEVHRSKDGDIVGYTLHWNAGDNPDVYPGRISIRKPELWMAQEEAEIRRRDMQWTQKMTKYIRAANEGGWVPSSPESQVWNFPRRSVESGVSQQEVEREASGQGGVQRAPEFGDEAARTKKSLPPPSYGGPRLVIAL